MPRNSKAMDRNQRDFHAAAGNIRNEGSKVTFLCGEASMQAEVWGTGISVGRWCSSCSSWASEVVYNSEF